MASSKANTTLVSYLLLFGTGLIWGSQYLLNKIALVGFSTWVISLGRVGIGALLLTFLCQWRPSSKTIFGKKFPDFILIGLLEATLPCVLVTWAQLRLASSVTAILIGTVPLFTTLLEFFFLPQYSLSAKKVGALLIGFFGIFVLVAPDFLSQSTVSFSFLSADIWSILAVLASAFFFALAMLLIKLRLDGCFSPTQTAQGILVGSSLTLLPLVVWQSYPWHSSWTSIPVASWGALLALAVFCGGIVYTLFVVLIHKAGPAFASTTNYLVPPIGAFLGIFFFHEKMSHSLIASLGLILWALWLSREEKELKKH